MKTILILGGLIAVAFNALASQSLSLEWGAFEREIICRERVNVTPVFTHITSKETDKWNEAREINSVKESLFAIEFGKTSKIKMQEPTSKEKMDSVVRISLDGNKISKQIFEYNNFGSPLFCQNLVPNPDGGWMNHSYYAYEYDGINRIMAREYVNDYEQEESLRYEYFYSDETPYYDSQVVYVRINGDWMPYQKASYKYDEDRNTIEELYASWSNQSNNWVDALKITSSYDNYHRMTSYFQYAWDNKSSKWIGYNPDGNNDGQEFYYTEDGKDSLIVNYDWENGDWLEYKHEIFTYDENGNLLKDAFEYWNRNKQDWSGYDKYGPYNYLETNYCIEYSYDENNRQILMEVINTLQDGSLKKAYKVESEYTDLEDDCILRKSSEYTTWKNTGVPELSKVDEQTFNRFGNEIHYLQYTYTIVPDVRINKTEEFRHYDEKGRFTGAEYYSFLLQENENTRYGDIKEEFFYNDPDPRAGYTEGHRYLGTSFSSDDAWAMSNSFYYEWENGVLISRIAKYPTDNGEIRSDGYEIIYDFDTPMENVIWWSATGKGADFNNNKTLVSTQYYNYTSQDTWEESRSYVDTYSYSIFSSASINVVPDLENVHEIERYNISGTKIFKPVPGINIVKYSDGTTKKIMVRK